MPNVIANEQFPPFNPNVTTDDVMESGSVIAVFTLIVAAFIMSSFTEHGRTWVNTFLRDEYRNKFTDDLSKHELLTGKFWGSWFMTWVNPLLSLFFAITMTIITWYFYTQQSNGLLVTPTDWMAAFITGWMGFWLCSLYCVCIADISNKMYLGYKVRMNETTEREKEVAEYLISIDGLRMMGVNAYTSINIRWAILALNTIFWGTLPLWLSMWAVSWDRSPNISDHEAIPDLEAGFVGTTGILLTLIWIYHAAKNIGNFASYYHPDGYTLKEGVENLTPYEMKMIQVGLTSDVFGPDAPLKGRLPFQYCPEHYALARSIFTWALGYCVFNDRLKAACLYIICGALPLVLNYLAGGDSMVYYITFEGMAWFFCFLFFWLNQGTFFYTSSERDINMNLLTLRPSATYPGTTPWDDWSVTIELIFGLAFSLTVVSFFKIFFGPGLGEAPFKDKKDGHLLKKKHHPVAMHYEKKERI